MEYFKTFIIGVIFVAITLLEYGHFIQASVDDELKFWQKSIVYQIYPRSILDNNGDGIGDLKGIASKVDYFNEIGVEIIWISPIFKSPMKDFGYDVADYREIDPMFGTMEDFDFLVSTMHSKGIKILMDFVPNHSSDEHEWFIKSVKNDPIYKDYYIWKDPRGYNETGDPIPPNNWVSVFRYSAWQWNEERKQFYYHAFLKEQPDLNYRNPNVVKDMQDVIKFWLDKGVDGFRVDAIIFLIEVENVYESDEPVSKNPDATPDPTQYGHLDHIYTTDLPMTVDIIEGFKQIVDQYSDRFMMVEAYTSLKKTMEYYGNNSNPASDFPFNFLLITNFKKRSDITGTKLKETVNEWLNNMPEGRWPNWVLGNHDNGRVASRFGKDMVDALNMFTLLLPGTPVTYYGEELGMIDTEISYKDTQDPAGCALGPDHYKETSRDPERTPMQWDDTKFAGFTKGNKTWIPVNDNYVTLNVEAQKKQPQSSLKVYMALARIRKEKTFLLGDLTFQVADKNSVAFIRHLDGEPSYMLVINTSKENLTVDATTASNLSIPPQGEVVIRSSTDNREETNPGVLMDLSTINLIAGEGIVFRFNQTL